jgi:predicted flavoprotein YhiN
MEQFDAVILGAGAAGLMCASSAGRRGRRVLVLDHAPHVGAKILISGVGRCNFTNTGTAPDRFVSANPPFARSVLSRYQPSDFLDLVEKHCILSR